MFTERGSYCFLCSSRALVNINTPINICIHSYLFPYLLIPKTRKKCFADKSGHLKKKKNYQSVPAVTSNIAFNYADNKILTGL